MRELFEDDDIRVLYAPGHTDTGWLTFASVEADGPFAARYLQRRGDAGVFVVPRGDHFFEAPGIFDAIESARALLPEGRRITYGSSRGAFGALACAKEVEADLVIAAAPITSVDPALVGHFDQRFASIHAGLPEARHDCREGIGAAEVVLIYDPMVREDREHARLIGGRHIELPHAGHAALHALREARVLPDLIDAVVAGAREVETAVVNRFRSTFPCQRHAFLALGERLLRRGEARRAIFLLDLAQRRGAWAPAAAMKHAAELRVSESVRPINQEPSGDELAAA